MTLDELTLPFGVDCLLCHADPGGRLLCPECEAELAAMCITAPICQGCGLPLQADEGCPFCREEDRFLARSACIHAGLPRELVHMLKFDPQRRAAEPLAGLMAQAANDLTIPADAIVTSVPMPEKRRRERGIDHAGVLAEAVAQALSLHYNKLLRRADDAQRQTNLGLGSQGRQANAQGAFVCDETLSGTVLLVDDVITTGSTIRACVEVLQGAGAERVLVLSATRAVQQS